MGCDVAIYHTKTIKEDPVTYTLLLERHELLNSRSWELGELLQDATAAPNGCTTTARAATVLDVLNDYVTSDELDSDEKEMIHECIQKLKKIIEADKDTVSVNVWY